MTRVGWPFITRLSIRRIRREWSCRPPTRTQWTLTHAGLIMAEGPALHLRFQLRSLEFPRRPLRQSTSVGEFALRPHPRRGAPADEPNASTINSIEPISA